MKVLVTGGAGFLGINLLRFLKKRGYEVKSFDIAPFAYEDAVEHIRGDVREKEAVENAAEGCDCIVHCASALPLYSEKDIRTTIVEGTKNVVSLGKPTIFISSTAVYGIPDHHPLVETDRVEGVGAYGTAKIEAEKACGENVTILRPKTFVGPERLGIFALFFEWVQDGHNFPLLNGKNRYQLLDVEDLCSAIEICIRKQPGGVYNVGAKDFRTMQEDFQAVITHAGTGRKIIRFPAAPFIPVLKILDKLHLSPLYQWIYETADKDSYVSIEKAERELDWHPQYSNKDALIRTYEWYVAHRKEYEGKSGVSHRVPWKQGILKVVKFFF